MSLQRLRWLIMAAVVTLGLVVVKAPADDVEREVDQLRQRAAQLQAEAEELARAGKQDEAQQLAAEAKKVFAHAHEAAAAHRGEADVKRRIEQLRKQAEELRETGHPEKAERLLSELPKILAAHLAKRGGAPGGAEHPTGSRHPGHAAGPEVHREIARRLHHLHMAAENLEAAGMGDQAHQLRAQAERLEQEMQREMHGRPGGPELPPQIREMQERMEQIQNQINQLRELVEDLRRAVEKR